jgi:tetratricopeptide (TPR) repeat protein
VARRLFEELVWQHPFDARIWLGFGQMETEAALAEPGTHTNNEDDGSELAGADILRAGGTATLELSAVDDLTWSSSVFHRVHGLARVRAVFRRGLIRAGGVWNEANIADDGSAPLHTFADYVGASFVPDIEGWNEKDADAGRWNSASKLYHAWALAEARFVERQRARQRGKSMRKAAGPISEHGSTAKTPVERQGPGSPGVQLARRLFQLCVQAVNGRDPIPWQAWARFEASLGAGSERAVELIKKGAETVQETNPTGATLACLYQTWGVLEQRQGRHDEAIWCFERAVALNPNHARTLHAWGVLEEHRGRIAEARALFERAIQVSNRSPDTAPAAYNLLGKLEWRQGRLDQARAFFLAGLEIAPGDPHLCHAIASLERHCGNYEQARLYFARCARVDELVVRDWADMETRDVGCADIQVDNPSGMLEAIETLSMLHILTRSYDDETPEIGREERARQLNHRQQRQRQRHHAGNKAENAIESMHEAQKRLMAWIHDRLEHDQNLLNALAAKGTIRTDQLRLWITRRREEDIVAFRSWARELVQSHPTLLRRLFRVPSRLPSFRLEVFRSRRKHSERRR